MNSDCDHQSSGMFARAIAFGFRIADRTALKGHGFSRAETSRENGPALAAEGSLWE
jgi:hypothetical protein